MINIIKRHPFHNGNKRTAWLATYLFLELNGYELKCPTDEATKLCVDIATSQDKFDLLKEYVSGWLEERSSEVN
ncbi:type II toxin-antitoxin system death-on-curing family toxin [Hutsoniella sourekii]